MKRLKKLKAVNAAEPWKPGIVAVRQRRRPRWRKNPAPQGLRNTPRPMVA